MEVGGEMRSRPSAVGPTLITVKVLVEVDAHSFAEGVMPWVEREPVACNVLATNLEASVAGRRTFADALWLAVIDDAGEVVGAAMHTPPHRLFVCPMPPDAVHLLAGALARVRPDLPGVTGVVPTVADFAAEWHRLAVAEVTPGMAQRIYRLDRVVPPSSVPGRRRDAATRDRALLLDWLATFWREAAPDQPVDVATEVVEHALAHGGWSLWEVDGRPVSLVGARPPAAGVARVGPVYTPVPERRQGYASACVAAVTERALEAGAQHCMLYTDLSNPTSNAIYRQIGYQPVCDAQEYAFAYV